MAAGLGGLHHGREFWPEDGDPARTAGRLLGRLPEADEYTLESIEPGWGGVINVPARFTAEELAAAAGTGDPRLAAAAAAGEEVTQYLAGVPGLLERYADPDGRAVIAAAMDATRFGHAGPLSAALLRNAAGAEAGGVQAVEPAASTSRGRPDTGSPITSTSTVAAPARTRRARPHCGTPWSATRARPGPAT